MDIASAYIPMDRRQALAQGRALPERSEGTVLFADISGFTPLTEALARELGPKRGAEELTVHLNRVYDALIAELHRLRGSVISFSGDAITCWFDQDDGRKATACALAMQATMQQFATVQTHAGNVVSLGMKAAVSRGAVRRFVVGLVEHTLVDAMAGKTLETVAAAEHQAARGDVVLDETTAVALADYLDVTAWRVDPDTGDRFAVITALHLTVPPDPWPALQDEDLTTAQRQAWMLPAVFERLRRGGGEFLAELRSAAALFMRFGGIDYDADDQAPHKLDALIQEVQRILFRYDGSLLQLTIGDKGSYLYAAFGAPITHEDNVDRALASALALQTLPQRFAFLPPMQIGVTYGRMRVGAYGGTTRRTYGVLGDAVNLSARLMSAAQPGQILVGSEAFARAGDSFVWETLPPIMVKGKTEPVPLKRLVRARRRRALASLDTLFPDPPVGRQEVLAALDGVLAGLAAGQGHVVHLVGEAGMGKSHLAAHFSRQALDQGVRVVLGSCQSINQNAAYTPWQEMLNDLLNLQEGSEEESVAQLRQFFQAQHPDWLLRLPLLGDVLNLPIPDNPTTAALDTNLRQQALFSLLVEMFQTWAQAQPLLLILNNVHWTDEASLALAQTVARQVAPTAPLLLLLLYRPPDVGEGSPLAELTGLAHTLTWRLREMPDADMEALMTRRLGAPPATLLLHVVQRVARGNPYFVGELLDAMRAGSQLVQAETGRWQVAGELLQALRRADFVVQVEGSWQLRPDADLSTVKMGLPDSIHGLILSRLDRLPEVHKLTLKVSSVIGYTFNLSLLAGSHPEDKGLPELEDEVAYMDAEQVLREEEPERKDYAFRHHTTQEVAYETLLFMQRQQLHAAVAGALVRLYPEATVQIAHHAYLGQLWPLALQHNLLAGEQARQLHAVQQSIDAFQKALDSARQLPEAETAVPRKQIHLALGELYVSTGQYTAAYDNLQMALQLARAQADRHAEARACRWHGRAFEQQAAYGDALDWLDQGFAALQGTASVEEAELSLIAGLIHLRQGNYDQTQALCQRSLQVGQTLNDAAIRARTYNLMGISDLRHSSAVAIERFTQSLALYEELGDVYGQATSHNLIANGYFAQGEWTRSDFHYRHSLDLFTQIGYVYNQVLGNNNLGGIALKQGRLDAALGYYQRAIRLLERTSGSLWVFGALHLNMGNTLLQRGELETAAAELQQSLTYLEQAQVRDLLPELYGLFAELNLRQETLSAATEFAQQSIALARELNMPREEGHNLRISGEIARAQGQLAQAETLLQESYRVLDAAGDEYERAKAGLALADLYAVVDRPAEALQSLAAAQVVFERLDATPDVVKAAALRRMLEGQAV
ncbi:MAG: tetratricopeptide repeat protein [Anaerolineales bacterium]|nr:tetratricopeptide repeat protein [Anaerolineales bacterium]